jgi:crotonobetainyl-CoA:carnitine CoA-transferase CaiB-like acyl-CoA transferase
VAHRRGRLADAAYERPESEVYGNKADNCERRAPGTAGMEDGVRYQVYRTMDGTVLFMASEQAFWKNFYEGVGRLDLFERWPGSKYADHAKGNKGLRAELQSIFQTRTSADWVDFGGKVITPIAPVNTPKSLSDDPRFQHRFQWLPATELGVDELPTPLKFLDEALPAPAKAPTVGEHTELVLRYTLGYDGATVTRLRESGALG